MTMPASVIVRKIRVAIDQKRPRIGAVDVAALISLGRKIGELGNRHVARVTRELESYSLVGRNNQYPAFKVLTLLELVEPVINQASQRDGGEDEGEAEAQIGPPDETPQEQAETDAREAELAERIKAGTPLDVLGLSPQALRSLQAALPEVDSVETLEEAIDDAGGSLAGVKGIGKKLAQLIEEAIEEREAGAIDAELPDTGVEARIDELVSDDVEPDED